MSWSKRYTLLANNLKLTIFSFQKKRNNQGQQPPNQHKQRKEKFLRSISFKAASLIKSSLPSGFPGDSETEADKNSRPESPLSSSAKDIATSLTETASSVLNRINPFDSPKNSFDSSSRVDTSARLFSKLEKTFGLHEEDTVESEREELELNSNEAALNSYANENDEDDDTEMLEYNQDEERSSLLLSSGSSKCLLTHTIRDGLL